MTDDEQFAESLRARVTRVAPRIDVDVTRVVPAARRRRAARAGGVTLALGLALAGGAWVVTTEHGVVLPGGSTTMPVEPSPSPTGPPLTSGEGDRLIDESSNRPVGPVVPPDGWRDASYFHVVTSSITRRQGEGDDDTPLGIERWYGDGVSFDLLGYGPELLDRQTYLNVGHDEDSVSFTWAELHELPEDPTALRAALIAAYGPTTEGYEVELYAAAALITDAPAPRAVRAAAWEVLTGMPGVEVEEEVRDGDDRPGTAATFEVFDRAIRLVYDEEKDVPLELEESIGKIHSSRLFLETAFAPLPDEVSESILEVPDVAAMTPEDVEAAFLQKPLTYTFNEEKSDTAPEGTVISSDPPGGSLVASGALVTIVLSSGP